MSQPATCPALFIAAPASGQGKTTITAALARRLASEGRDVRVFKTGPDFLDPKILEQASGHPVYQLDLWMGGEAHIRRLLQKAALEADLILIEGVMGLFDGEKSSADLATLFNIPVMAVIDGSSMAQTFGALAHGLATYRKGLPFAGVFANRVGSDTHFDMLRESLPEDIEMFGRLPRDEDFALPSRHLGLVQADEIADLEQRIDRAATNLDGIDLQQLPAASFSADPKTLMAPALKGLRIAIARDAAFSFLYPANLDLLRKMGAELSFFSPLADSELPPADSLYLPGGYPELHIPALTENKSMRLAIRDHHIAGKPIHAECGGMLYLFDELFDKHSFGAGMVGLLPGRACMKTRLTALGMHEVELPEGVLRGHTYHYSKLETALTPLAESTPARKGRKPEAVYRQGSLTASYLHLYFPSNPAAVARLFAPQTPSTKEKTHAY